MNFLAEQRSKEAAMNRGKKMVKMVRTTALLIGIGFALSACADADTAGYAYGPDYGYEEPDYYGEFGFFDGGGRDHDFRHDRDRGFDHGEHDHMGHGIGHEGGVGGGHAGFGGGHGGGFGGGHGGGGGGGGHGR
jgi:hypothetical protein